MTPKELKLKMIDLSEELISVLDTQELLEDRGKLLGFIQTFWREQSENLLDYTRARGEIQEMAKKGLAKQRAMLRDKIKSEK